MSCLINFTDADNTPVPAGFFKGVIEKSIRQLKVKDDWEFSLALVDRRAIRRLNKKYRQRDKATDILTFVFRGKRGSWPKNDRRILGEIIICPPLPTASAQKSGQILKKRLAVLTIHGLLHLLGYGHREKKQRKKMEAWENKLIKTVI